MAFSFSPKAVTDGLVLALDAANPRSYVSGSTVWRDLTANQITGSLINSPTYNSAEAGSISFDGTDDYVQISPTSVINNLAQRSITGCAWIYPLTSGLNGTGRIMNKRAPGALGQWNGWLFFMNGNNGVGFQTLVASAVNAESRTSSTSLLNKWSYVVFTYNELGDKYARLYINGVEGSYSVYTQSTGTTANDSAGFLRIGDSEDPSGSPRAFNGRIADCRLYNRVLSATEILQNYNALKGRFNLT